MNLNYSFPAFLVTAANSDGHFVVCNYYSEVLQRCINATKKRKSISIPIVHNDTIIKQAMQSPVLKRMFHWIQWLLLPGEWAEDCSQCCCFLGSKCRYLRKASQSLTFNTFDSMRVCFSSFGGEKEILLFISRKVRWSPWWLPRDKQRIYLEEQFCPINKI